MAKGSGRPVIGLTGGIAAGKSTVAALFEALGCVVTHSDEDGRAALRDPAIRDELVRWWGRQALDDDGMIDRRAIAHIVFADVAERRRLEALTHPWIEARRHEQWAAAPDDAPAFVIDAPLLMEVGLDEQCDAVVFVDADDACRLERVREHRGWSEAELRAREESQMPLDAKRSAADYVIVNHGDREQLARRVRQILNEIIERHEGGAHGFSARPSSSRASGPPGPAGEDG